MRLGTDALETFRPSRSTNRGTKDVLPAKVKGGYALCEKALEKLDAARASRQIESDSRPQLRFNFNSIDQLNTLITS